jgi:hypothetical protein
MSGTFVRPAAETDAAAIARIYNQAVLNTTATFDTEVESADKRLAWLRSHSDARHPVLVAEVDGEVVGWASLSSWSDRCAYAASVEASAYVDEAHQDAPPACTPCSDASARRTRRASRCRRSWASRRSAYYMRSASSSAAGST